MRRRMLSRRIVLTIVVTVGTLFGGVEGLGAGGAQSAANSSPVPAATMTSRQFLDTYCTSCHSEKRKANFANLALDSVDVEALGTNAATWEKVIKKLRVRAMPPVNMPRPTLAAYDAMVATLEQGLDRGAGEPNPGRSPVHRLNRLQYA